MTCPGCKLEFTPDKHSDEARSYYHAVVVPFFQMQWSRARINLGLPPYTHDQTHDVMVQAIYPGEAGPLPGTVVRQKTRHMTKREYHTLTEKARALAFELFQARIPQPNEIEWEGMA